MTYTIIGGDNKEYGPISADDIRLWIREGRLNTQSRIKNETDTTWRALGSFPEFADALNPQTPPTIGMAPAAAGGTGTTNPNWQAEVEARQPDLRLGECLAAGGSLLGQHFGFLIGAVLLTWIVTALFGLLAMFIPILGPIASICFASVMMGGYYYACLRRLRGENVGAVEVFSGFKQCFGQLLLAGLVSVLLTEISCCFLVIPCIYLAVAWSLTFFLVIDKGMFFWGAMELSRKVVTKAWFEMLALLIVGFLPVIIAQTINIICFFNYGIDLYHASNDDWQQVAQNMQARQPELRTLGFKAFAIGQAGMLITLFYVGGVMARAYENLFGPRK